MLAQQQARVVPFAVAKPLPARRVVSVRASASKEQPKIVKVMIQPRTIGGKVTVPYCSRLRAITKADLEMHIRCIRLNVRSG